MAELRKRYYNGIQIVDVLNRHIDRPETIMNCLNNFSNLEVDDAVEVVRCRDCEFWDMELGGEMRYCAASGSSWRADEFCSDGERREECHGE